MKLRSIVPVRALIAIVIAWLFFFPILFMIMSSFKSENDIRQLPMELLPRSFEGINQYLLSFDVAPLALYLTNSSIMAAFNVIVTVIVSAMAGYGFAKFRFAGRQTLFFIILATMMVPFQILVVPLFVQVKFFGWANSYTGLIVPGIMNAFGVFMMRQFALKVPDAIIDAARVDGASEFRIFREIVFPLLRPASASLAIIIFLWTWGNFLWPLVVIQDRELTVLATGMTNYLQPYHGQALWGPAMAASTIATIPIAFLFLFFQRYFVSGLTASAVKG